MLLTWLDEKFSVFRLGMAASTEMSLIWLFDMSSDSSAVHALRAEMSVRPRPERLSSVTSLSKVTPPRVISTTVCVGVSVRMVQPGSSSCSASSSSSVISRPRMSRVVSPSRP